MISNRGEKTVKNYTYNMEAMIGEGSFSKVYLGKNDQNGENVAIKVITQNSLKNKPVNDLLQKEISTMKQLNHPNIVRLFEVFSTMNNVYIIEEFCEAGDVGKLLKEKGRISESIAFEILKDVIKGFKELLKYGIIHRDMKPANIFISKEAFKLGDFGFAEPVKNSNEKMVTTFIGTPLYMSPQCLQNGAYSSKCDIWSIGVTYYQLLVGSTPWKCNNHFELLNKIFTQRISLPNNLLISDWSKNFLMRTLIIDEENRISWEQIFNDPIFQERKPEIIEIHSDESQSTNSDDKPIVKFSSENLISNKFLLHLNNILHSLEQVKSSHCLSQWLYEKLYFLSSKHKTLLLLKVKNMTINGEFEFDSSIDQLEKIINEIYLSKNYDLLTFDEKFNNHFHLNLDQETDFYLSLQYYIMMAIRQCNHYLTLAISSNRLDSRTEHLMMFLRNMTNYYQALMIQNNSESKLDVQKLSKIFSSTVPSNSFEGYQKLREKIYVLNI